MPNGFVLMVDVLGFSRIIENLEEKEADKRIEEWAELVGSLADKYDIGDDSYQLLSDTLFVTVDGKELVQLETLVQFGQELLSVGLSKSFPLRGAITQGHYEWGAMIYGKAIIDAHTLERRQDWLGITLSMKIKVPSVLFETGKLICYATPFKSGQIGIYAAINWDIPDLETLQRQCLKGGLGKQGEFLGWEFGSKLRNTMEFKIYKELVSKQGLPFAEYHTPSLPIRLIHSALK